MSPTAVAGSTAALVALAAAAGRRLPRPSARAAAKKEELPVPAELDVALLLEKYKAEIDELRSATASSLGDEHDDTWLLRFVLQQVKDDKVDLEAATTNVGEVLEWRSGAGKATVDAATTAIAAAQADGKWNNEPVLAAAPHSDKVSKFLTPSAILVVSLETGDLVSCIRAATIDSPAMMKEVSEDELVEFFIYSREVNSQIADARTRASGRLIRLIAANDLTGVSSFPDPAFQAALTRSSKEAVTLYPGTAGPTVLLNLPWIARQLVKLLTPLFPGAVREKLKFAQGPMSYMEDLTDILKEPIKSNFVDDLRAVLES